VSKALCISRYMVSICVGLFVKKSYVLHMYALLTFHLKPDILIHIIVGVELRSTGTNYTEIIMAIGSILFLLDKKLYSIHASVICILYSR